MSGTVYDLAVIGGGINGVGIAADAAGRGLTVLLLEKGDLAGGTSSASSKLIHGGLRYLEHGEFRLVRHALAEREVLLRRAEHLIQPLRFVIPHVAGMRPPLLMRAGLFLYDWLAWRRRIPASGVVDLATDPMGRVLRPDFSAAFSYYDCWCDDARLAVTVARDAANRGAHIFTRTPAVRVAEDDAFWRIDALQDGAPMSFRARAVVNAAGPWSAEIAKLGPASVPRPTLHLVRGSHIVVPRVADADDALLLQNTDGRIVFVLPFGRRFTMIGTTEVRVATPEDGSVVSADEEAYLLQCAARFLARPLSSRDIVWRFAGVRPLVDDGAETASALTRDWRLDVLNDSGRGGSGRGPWITVVGGKITTFRLLAEAVLDRLLPFFPGMASAWTAGSPLPGGDFGAEGIDGFRRAFARRYPAFHADTIGRLVSRYGTFAGAVAGDATCEDDLGPLIAGGSRNGGVAPREVDYLRRHEWAVTPGDVLWRRTKAGIELDTRQREQAEADLRTLLASA